MASERITPSDRQGLFSNSLNGSVLDPEQLMDGVRLAMFHIENGERSFEAYVKAMNDEFDGYGPFLLMWYNAVREYPGFDPRGMTPRDKITPELLQRLGVDTPPRRGNIRPRNRTCRDSNRATNPGHWPPPGDAPAPWPGAPVGAREAISPVWHQREGASRPSCGTLRRPYSYRSPYSTETHHFPSVRVL
jgi:hypothetical protein